MKTATAAKKPTPSSLDLQSLVTSMGPAMLESPVRVLMERLAWTFLHVEALRQLGGLAQTEAGAKRAGAMADAWWAEELARPYALRRADVAPNGEGK